MLLATYQSHNWENYKNNTKYPELKKLLNLQPDKNIYWCFAANTPKQAIINSVTVEPNSADRFILFETDDFTAFDKIKWNRLVETNDFDNNITDDVLNIYSPDTAEYIVTKIPETRFEFDLQDPACMLEYKNILENKKTPMATILSLGDTYAKNIEDLKTAMINTIMSNSDKELNNLSLADKEAYMNAYIFKGGFESSIMLPVYLTGLCVLGKDDPDDRTPVMFNLPDAYEYITMQNICTYWNRDLPNLSDKIAYDALTRLRRTIYTAYFTPRGKIPPNSPCPCGSGKKYKKCCKDAANVDIKAIMSET